MRNQNLLYLVSVASLAVLFNNCGQGYKTLEIKNSGSILATPTATPMPTATPVPSTPTPTSTPVPPTATPTPIPGGTNISNGQSVTVSGSNFGTKPQAAPQVYDDFERGSLNTNVEGRAAVVGGWDIGSWSSAVTYAGTSPLQGSQVARHSFRNGNYNASLYFDTQATQTVYLDFWIKAVPIQNKSRNWKTWRFYDSGSNERGNDVYYCNEAGGVGLDPPWFYKSVDYNPGEWMHYEVIARYGNGSMFIQYRNEVPDGNASGFSNNASITEVRIGHYWGLDAVDSCSANPGADVYTDMVYIDTSLARVVLGNASTFASSTNRAIQRPTAWSSGSVSYIANTHGFNSGQTVYEFVIDANNIVRSTRPLRVQ